MHSETLMAFRFYTHTHTHTHTNKLGCSSMLIQENQS